MFWADKVAQELKERKLSLEWVDDMKTPSGRVHVGALRGVIVHDLAYKALKDAGLDTRYTYVFEDQDPMDGLPIYLPKDIYQQYMGLPLFKVPSPEKGYKNYAEYYALEFKKVFNAIGCNPDIIWVTELYKSGKMNSVIKEVLDKAPIIREIYKEMYKKELPDTWYPYQLYCPKCGKVVTTEVYAWDGEMVSYKCIVDKVDWTKGCGAEGVASPFSTETEVVGKLPWKVEWPSKWKVIGITVEGAGKDHMSSGGSHDIAKLICERVLNYPVPYPLPYEFILVGGKKMSSSKGLGSSAKDMLDILPPTLLRFLMVKTKLNQAINFDPAGDTIPKLFDEYQRYADAYFNKTDEELARIFELSQVGTLQKPSSIRFSVLAQWVQMPNMEQKIKDEGLEEWAAYARVWVEKYAPDSEKFLVQKEIPESVSALTERQKHYLQKVAEELNNGWDAEALQVQLYEWTKEMEVPSKDAFAALYTALLGKKHGPKAAWLLLSLDKEFVKKRLVDVSQMRETKKNNNDSITYLNKPEIFLINQNLGTKYPSISVGVAVVKGVKIAKENEQLEKEKENLLHTLSDLTTEELGKFPEILSYRRLYKEMGVDWHSRRPSPEALLRRVALKKGLYTVNTCVDAYNLVVMKNRVSVGAFDYDMLEFPTELRLARVHEEILLLGDTEPTKYKESEIAYFDQKGGFNIDFNYRDAQRTAVSFDTENLYINVDGIYDITASRVEEVLQETCDIIIKHCGGTVEEFGVQTAEQI